MPSICVRRLGGIADPLEEPRDVRHVDRDSTRAHPGRDPDLEAYRWEWMCAVDEHISHAGELETAVLLHLCSEDIDGPVVGDALEWDDTVDGGAPHRFIDVFSETGAVGDTTGATTEQDEALFQTAVDPLVSSVTRVE